MGPNSTEPTTTVTTTTTATSTEQVDGVVHGLTVMPPSDDPTEVMPSKWWIRDARGFGSVTVTLTVIAFWVTCAAYVLSIFDHIGPVSIRPFDIGACSAFFIPILTLYGARKFTDAKFKSDAGK